ncbi:MAG: AAA family ATPase [Akkermansia sp.]|nr:AAA family ATPase [Akkermansia sp.]
MILDKFRVTNFRSVKDSGWVETDNITTLVGINESGKSNILLALWKLNPASGGKIDYKTDLPITRLSEDREKLDEIVFIEAIFKTTEEEQQLFLQEEENQDEEADRDLTSITVCRKYDSTYIIKDANNNLIDNKLHDKINQILPHFIYYSNYGNLSGKIYLPHAIEWQEGRTVPGIKKNEDQERTINVLFKFVNLNPQELIKLSDTRYANRPNGNLTEDTIKNKQMDLHERFALLQSASSRLSREFKAWWKQGEYNFRFDASGEYFAIYVSDNIRKEEVPLELRSTGLQWFLSFYLIFLVESDNRHKNCVLLLDEAGLTLHPLAQKDLAVFFETLSESNQIIHTTHSPFIVDTTHLERCKSVAVDEEGYTYVTSDLRKGSKNGIKEKSIYALHAALGLGCADVLFHGCQCVVVEGISDQYYLNAIKLFLLQNKSISYQREVLFLPSGGVKNITTLTSIVSAKKDDLPHVIIDSDVSGHSFCKKIKEQLYKNDDSKIHMVGTYLNQKNAEIEDLIPPDIVERAIAPYLQNEEMISFCIAEGEPYVNQIESFANDYGITLPDGWKVEIAKKIKIILSKTPKEKIDDKYINIWSRLFDDLS